MQLVLIVGIILILIALSLLRLLFFKRKSYVLFLFLLCLLPGLALSFIGYNIGDYTVFNGEVSSGSSVAIIKCKPVKNQIYDMVLSLAPINSKREDEFLLTGNQWALEGSILVIKFPAKFKDVYLYKLTRIKSRFLNLRDQAKSPRIYYSVAKIDSLGSFFKKHKSSFVESVFAETGYFLPKENIDFHLYAGLSGFTIKKKTSR